MNTMLLGLAEPVTVHKPSVKHVLQLEVRFALVDFFLVQCSHSPTQGRLLCLGRLEDRHHLEEGS